MKIYVVMVDEDGNLRSSPDVARRAFRTREAAYRFAESIKDRCYGTAVFEVELEES